jgi:hypothetical protein
MGIPTSNQVFVEPPRLTVVSTLPSLGEAEIGEMYLLTTDMKIYVRCTSGWGYTAALTAV